MRSKPFAHDTFDLFQFIRNDLIDNNAQYRHLAQIKQGFIEHDLINSPADAAAGDNDDLAAQQGGHIRIGAINHRAHPRMARAFDNDGVLAAGDGLKRFKDLVLQLLFLGSRIYFSVYPWPMVMGLMSLICFLQ